MKNKPVGRPASNETPSETSAFLSLFLWSNGGGTAYSF